MIRLASWNVNGIRACFKNGFLDWFKKESFDFVALQEVRAEKEQIPQEVLNASGFNSSWFAATSKKGYSGVGILTKLPIEKTFSGYPGGLKHETRGNLLKRRGISEVLMRTVKGMLPRNKLRDEILKNLSVTE
jgi:exodeoxyribonuclease-3